MNETRMNETRMNETDERYRMWDWLLYPLVAFSMAIQLVLAIPTILLWIVLESLFRFGLFGSVFEDIWDPEAVASWSSWTEDWDMVEGPAETGGADHE
jgi:hypothetical protein